MTPQPHDEKDFFALRERAREVLATAEPPLDEIFLVSGWLLDAAMRWDLVQHEFGSGEIPQRQQLLDLVSSLRAKALRLTRGASSAEVASFAAPKIDEILRRLDELRAEETSPRPETLAARLALEARLFTIDFLLHASYGTSVEWLLADSTRGVAWLDTETERAKARLPAADWPTGQDDLAPDRSSGLLEALELDSAAQSVSQIRGDIAESRHRVLVARARAILAGLLTTPLPDRFELLLTLTATGAVLGMSRGVRPDSDSAGSDAKDTESALQGHLESALASSPRPVRAWMLEGFVRRLEERVDEVIASSIARPNAEALRLLEALRPIISWLRRCLKRFGAADRTSTESSRSLARLDRSVEDQILDCQAIGRLEARFGRSRLDSFARLTFVCVGILTVILGIELTVGFPSWAGPGIEILDGVLCSVLLAELASRVIASRRPLRYLRRHALIELVPAIPIGLFTGVMSSSAPAALRGAVRWLEVARPALGLVRLGVLALRGMDRLVWRWRSLLRPNIILFEPRRETERHGSDLRPQVGRLRAANSVQMRWLCGQVPGAVLSTLLPRALDELASRTALAASVPVSEGESLGAGFPPEYRVEALIEDLEALRPESVQDFVTPRTAARMGRLQLVLNVPFVRRLPFIRQVVPKSKQERPEEALARCGRALGSFGRRVVGIVTWNADFKGLISGPTLLDRIGFFLVGYTQRPAKRLVIFGIMFLIIKFFLDLLFVRVSALESIAGIISRYLGLGLVVIGLVCMAVMGLGIWLRRIAGDATDVYRNLVEAQHFSLLETRKEATRGRDLDLIGRRFLSAEAVIRPDVEVCLSSAGSLEGLFRPGLLRAISGPPAALRDLERLGLLYRDFLDGPVIHSRNTKVIEQLLGNLVLQTVRLERLGYGRKEQKRLDALELRGGRALLGPHMWFRLVTTSLAEQTAKLLLEFNRYCIPLEEMARATTKDIEAMQRWSARLRGEASGAQRAEVDRERRRVDHFQTTAFNALHFLANEASREAEVGEQFGEQARELLVYARTMMFRRIFGSYPLQTLPRDARTLNLYGLYQRNLARGRALLFPVRIVLRGLRSIGRLFRVVAATTRDLLNPAFLPEVVGGFESSVTTARRKIDRMRRAVFLEAMRLRAEFDPEYLGITLPGGLAPPAGFATCEDDLDDLDATGIERDLFQNLRDSRRARLQQLSQILLDTDCLKNLGAGLQMLAPRLTPEGLRAICVAWLIDYRGVCSVLSATPEAPPKPMPGRREASRLTREEALKLLDDIGLQPRDWSTQLVTVRMVQSLAVLDLLHLREAVESLGRFARPMDESKDSARPAPVADASVSDDTLVLNQTS